MINSAIIKLGKLTKAQAVYRGVNTGVLPPEFWAKNEYDVKGGVESSFMSCTTNRDVAMTYAQNDSCVNPLVLEMQMGMIDRGADLGWLSQVSEHVTCARDLRT